jgi:predicted transglutaminase-like cysteine proteinase
MQSRLFLLVTAFVFALGSSGCTTTAPRHALKPVAFTDSRYIPEKQRVVEPFAHAQFCVRVPNECIPSKAMVAVADTPAKMAELMQVNRDINKAIAPRLDPGFDTWTLFPQAGDCDDYAVTKRHVLIAQGWPASSLRLAIGKTRTEEGHLVLVARTGDGDMVLDNLSNEIRPWSDMDIEWLTIQSSTEPYVWHKIVPEEFGTPDSTS